MKGKMTMHKMGKGMNGIMPLPVSKANTSNKPAMMVMGKMKK